MDRSFFRFVTIDMFDRQTDSFLVARPCCMQCMQRRKNRIRTKFEQQAETSDSTSWVVEYYHMKSNMAAGHHLEINGYDVITWPLIDRLLQNLEGRCKMICQ